MSIPAFSCDNPGFTNLRLIAFYMKLIFDAAYSSKIVQTILVYFKQIKDFFSKWIDRLQLCLVKVKANFNLIDARNAAIGMHKHAHETTNQSTVNNQPVFNQQTTHRHQSVINNQPIHHHYQQPFNNNHTTLHYQPVQIIHQHFYGVESTTSPSSPYLYKKGDLPCYQKKKIKACYEGGIYSLGSATRCSYRLDNMVVSNSIASS